MRNIARKAITATMTVAATAAFGLGASSEAWGGKTSSWERVGTTGTSSWERVGTTGTSSWERVGTTGTSSWERVGTTRTSSWE